MQLPEEITISVETGGAIAGRHGLGDRRPLPLPNLGIINSIYLLGDDLVLRVPRNHPAHVAQLRTDVVAAVAARAAGVRTPRLSAFDDALDLLPVPYALYERASGEALERLGLEPEATPDAWRELGRDLARLHAGVRPDGPAGGLHVERPGGDPRALAEARAEDGWISGLEARWLVRWLDRLEPSVREGAPRRFLHLDAQATNVLVDPASRAYRALLDWGCAGWGDAAWDFCAVPFAAIPPMLEGHRALLPLDDDETAEARILWRRLSMALAILPRGAAKGLSWGERPVAWLVDLLRFFYACPPRWRDLSP